MTDRRPSLLVLASAVLVFAATPGPRAQADPAPTDEAAALAAEPAPPADEAAAAPSVDSLGDALPEGALARLGHLRLRHAGEITALRFDAPGQRLLSSTRDEERAWSVADGGPLALDADADARALPPAPPGMPAAFDSMQLVVRAAPDERAWLSWSLQDGATQLHVPGGQASTLDLGGRLPTDAAFSADASAVVLVGDRVTSRSDYGTWVLRVDIATAAPSWGLDLPGMTPTHVVVAPAHGEFGPSVVVASGDGRMVRRRLSDGAAIGEWRAHEALVSALGAGVDGDLLSACVDGELAAWDLAETPEAEAARLRWRRTGHLIAVTALATSRELELVASGGRDRRVRLWSWADGEPRAERPTHDARLSLALAERAAGLAASADWTGRIGLWDLSGLHRAWIDAHEGRVTGLALLRDASVLLSAGQDGQLALWDPRDGSALGARQATDAAITALAATADGRHLASSGGDGLVRLWSLAPADAGQPARLVAQGALSAGGRPAFALAYLPDGAALALGTSHVRLVDAASGELRWETALGAPVAALSVSLDGQRIAVALASRTVVVLDAADGAELWRWSGHPGRVTAVAFAPDGRRVAAAGGDARVRLRDMTAAGAETSLEGHLEEVVGLRWSADGLLVSAAADGTTLLWRP